MSIVESTSTVLGPARCVCVDHDPEETATDVPMGSLIIDMDGQ